MAGNILTPNLIWKDFQPLIKAKANSMYTVKKDGIIINRFYLDGLSIKGNVVSIYGCLTELDDEQVKPLVVCVHDFALGETSAVDFDLIKQGYAVVSIDLAGFDEKKENYTKYSQGLEYANYQNAKSNLFTIEEEVGDSCWYVWTSVMKYALRYFASQKKYSRVGVLAFGHASTVAWQAVATEEKVACAVFGQNTGWKSYNKYFKYSTTAEPLFSNETLKFVAGVEVQSYVSHVSCPVLVLSSTNNSEFDVDRAYATISRIDEKIYSNINYSVNYRNVLDKASYLNLLQFFKVFLKKEGKKTDLSKDIDIKTELVNDKIEIIVKTKEENFKTLDLYCAEEQLDPAKRCWEKLSVYKSPKKNVYVFEYTPYKYSKIAFFFVKMENRNGFTTCSDIIAKRFEENQSQEQLKQNLVYSSRIKGSESAFAPYEENFALGKEIDAHGKGAVRKEKGALGFYGITNEHGLITFKMGESKYHPTERAILMFDAYFPEGGEMSVSLIADINGEVKTYTAKCNVVSGNIWNNIKISLKNFKTEEGMTLKSYEKVFALAFLGNGKCVINNVLWV